MGSVSSRAIRVFFLLAGALIGPGLALADDPAPAGDDKEEFFEKRVRPVLAESCWRCHGDTKQSSGLRLDSRERMLEGGEDGPAIVPGKPDESLLVQAIRHDGDIRMPPKSKPLPSETIQDLSTWIRDGAHWPAAVVEDDSKSGTARTHWSFQPVWKPSPPQVNDLMWVATQVDAFILAQLESRGMSPSPQADKRTLIRRVTFDLIGLPPTPEEVEAFLADESPGAFAKVVDRLLASPHYGERWGRHWLDVARYADTKGYNFQGERNLPFAYTYRDYVINAFNEDLPYDRFIAEQIAADQLPPLGGKRALQALGFLTVGRRFLDNADDIIDDRIDVVTRGLMGLTVTCARCHDHKYDPIPTDDYYSLYGVFASSVEPKELPVLDMGTKTPEFLDYQKKHEQVKKDAEQYLEGRRVALQDEMRKKIATYLLAAYDLEFDPRHAKYDERVRDDKLRPELMRWFMGRWKERLDVTRDGQDPFYAPWHAFAALAADKFEQEASSVVARLAPARPLPATPPTDSELPENPFVNPQSIAEVIAATPPASMREVVQRYGDVLARAGHIETATDSSVPDEAWRVAEADDGPFRIADEELRRAINRAERDKLVAIQKKVDELDVTHPGAPPRAMVINDKPKPYEPHVFVRGDSKRPGKAVPRRFLKVVSGPNRKPFTQGSGRLELARSIATASNPMTARVIVNRVWQHHFGEGLVRTPSDYGLRGDPPTHPELLDYLAARFVEQGWSIKRLHRLIVLSSTYQQRSDARPEYAELDPQNLLLSRQNRLRLDFEAMRDSLLEVSGQLDKTIGGRAVSLTAVPSSPRRTVYGHINRQNLEGLFRTFDFASPDASTPQRPVTIVPQQALFLMNSPFAIEQAEHLARRLDALSPGETESRIQYLYQLLFSRPAEPHEVELGVRFLASRSNAKPAADAPKNEITPWPAYAQVLLETNEFMYVD
jgi:Protein of unknown function (DUF1553)/Protein of unknown function (DUF1549)/Planctomycete cytochrome C